MSKSKEIYHDLLTEKQAIISDLDKINDQLSLIGEEKRSIIIKKIKGESYYYEQWREKEKVNSHFLGKVSPGIVAETEKQIELRNHLLAERKEKTELLGAIEKSILLFRKCMRRESIIQDYSFEVFYKDELSARVKVNGGTIKVTRFLKHPAKQIFAKDTMTRAQLNEILALRCCERGRADINDKLHNLGLTEYNPYEIVKKTHGVSFNDYIWIRFPGENLTASDVLVRT